MNREIIKEEIAKTLNSNIELRHLFEVFREIPEENRQNAIELLLQTIAELKAAAN